MAASVHVIGLLATLAILGVGWYWSKKKKKARSGGGGSHEPPPTK